jgi:phage recombination protein Bet
VSTHTALTRIGDPVNWWDDPRKVELVTRTVAQGATPDELAMFQGICQRTGLDPFTRQIYALRLNNKLQFQVSIDGLRLIAKRSGQYAGQVGPEWCGMDAVWRDVWLDDGNPAAARVGVLLRGVAQPTYGVAHWREYAKGGMWAKMPALMLAKVAESLALRKAFPQELSGIYSGEEMGSDVPSPVGSDPLPDAGALPRGGDSDTPFTEPLEGQAALDDLRVKYGWEQANEAMRSVGATTRRQITHARYLAAREILEGHATIDGEVEE